ncbi:MAG: hypothetical protein KGN33_18960 [Paracoccaceae bacterium]|nr:hypothetical protein [Paracoccaceae bacterium]
MAKILDSLQQRLSGPGASWLTLGDVLAQLDELGTHSADGRPWTEVVREAHQQLGHGSVSLGHLQKVRRVRNFVRKVLETEGRPFSDSEIAAAQVSALEVAERLHSLDPELGKTALLDCIRARKKFVDLQREYDDYVERHPDRLPRKQTTWLKKRKSTAVSDDAALVEKIILAQPEVFVGMSMAVLRTFDPGKSSPFLKATDFGFRISGPHEERTLGVEVIADLSSTSKSPVAWIAQLEFQSGFFDHYWAFTRADAATVGGFSALMSELRINRIGLLRLLGDQTEVVRHPSSGSPVPDRRDFLKTK